MPDEIMRRREVTVGDAYLTFDEDKKARSSSANSPLSLR
jgi:hypothetical protein